jgi:O-Antigen ligase
MVEDETLSLVVSPIVVIALLYTLARAPIRYSMMGIMFVAMTIENPDEQPAAGMFKSPLFPLGGLLLTHLNKRVAIPVFGSMSGLDIMLIVLLLTAWARKMSGSRIDSAGRIETPKILVQLALLSLVGIVWVLLVGMMRGGDFSMALWQIDKVIHLPVVFLLFHIGLRGPKDHLAMARVVVGAAMVKALFAVYVVNTVVLPPADDGSPGTLQWATSHHDSILFGGACVILVSLMMERIKGAWKVGFAILPILFMGMIANNRRMVWVQVLMVFVTLYFSTPTNPAKRKVKYTVFALSPFIAAYLAIGWDQKGGIFKPVNMIRSIVDPETDASTLWRQIENYDILFTIKQFWIFGYGYGNGYWEVMPLPPIDYSLERYLPHNSLLGLWCFAGVAGYTAITLLWGAGVFFAIRAYYTTKKPVDRVTALACTGAVLIYMVQCYGDVGLGSWTGVFTVGSAVAIAGKLAVAVGAFPSTKKVATKPAPQPVQASVEGQVA